MERVILHCDINNFYASVEMQLNKELLGKSVAVCGDPERRHGIVLAKSNLAKAAGVKTGDTIWQAKQKSPDIIIVPPTFKKYTEYSKIIYGIYTEFTSEVESFGLDECWLDVTGCYRLFGGGESIAYKIKDRVREVTGLTISVGVSFNKVFAKLGSDLKKPDAVTIISKDNFKTVVWRLKADEMLFVGKKTAEKLKRFGIVTIGDIANAPRELLKSHFGKAGEKIHIAASGEDNEEVKNFLDVHIPKSVGNGTTTEQDITNLNDASSVIFALCEMIGFRLRQYNMIAGGVSVYYRDNIFNGGAKQGKLDIPSSGAGSIAKRAIELLKDIYDFSSMPPLRMLTVNVFSLLSEGDYVQESFFSSDEDKRTRLNKSIDTLREKYGYGVLKRAINIGTIFNCDSREADDEFLPFDKNLKNL